MKTNGMSKWMIVICCVLVIAAILLFVFTQKSVSDYNKQYMANNVKIGDLTEQVAALKAATNEVVTEEVAGHNVKSCADLGNAVAKYQTTYQHMSASEDYDAWMENVNLLDACFADGWKESRIPWFFADASYDIEWNWTFQSTYEFVNKKIDVLWLCHDVNTGDLIGFTTGIYDSELGVFSDVKFTYTSIGVKYLYASPDAQTPEQSVDDEDSENEYDPTDDNTVDSSQGPDDIGGGGAPVDTSQQPDGIGSGGAPVDGNSNSPIDDWFTNDD